MTEYVELRCRSAFSFLRGASLPEDLVARAAALGYRTLALTDRESLSGAVRFHKAARRVGVQPIVGAEVPIEGAPLLLLCESQAGYGHLCRLLTRAGREAAPLRWADLEAHASGLFALTGGAEGLLGAALDRGDPQGAAEVLDRLVAICGPAHLAVEVQVHLDQLADRRNGALVELARRHRLPPVLTNDVHYATPAQGDLCDVLTCVREPWAIG